MDTFGRKFVLAPFQSAPVSTGSIQGVWLVDDEEVEWVWTYGLDGKSWVSGYAVRKKTPLPETYAANDEEER